MYAGDGSGGGGGSGGGCVGGIAVVVVVVVLFSFLSKQIGECKHRATIATLF